MLRLPLQVRLVNPLRRQLLVLHLPQVNVTKIRREKHHHQLTFDLGAFGSTNSAFGQARPSAFGSTTTSAFGAGKLSDFMKSELVN